MKKPKRSLLVRNTDGIQLRCRVTPNVSHRLGEILQARRQLTH